MNAVFFDPSFSDDDRREWLYRGQLFVFSPRPSTLALCTFARGLIEKAFAPLDPRNAQFHLSLSEFHDIVSRLQGTFVEHPEGGRYIQRILEEMSCDLRTTYFESLYVRNVPSDVVTGGRRPYTFRPHRDTWHAAPLCQVNWWIPLYDMEPENCLAFHPHYWRHAVRNGSVDYHFGKRANEDARRIAALQHSKATPRSFFAEEPIDPDSELRLVCRAGGIIMFSGAHLHSSVPNTSGSTRFSLDFRTAQLEDLREQCGAPNVDGACDGTVLTRFRRAADFSPIPDDVIARYDVRASPGGQRAAPGVES
jgi:hypothetical protein